MTAVVFGIVIVINLAAGELPEEISSIDVTSTKLYSITDTTKEYLKTLEEDVTIYVLASEKNSDETLSETLNRYEDLSGHVIVEYKDPAVNPSFYQQYTQTAPSSNSLIIVSSQRSRLVDYSLGQITITSLNVLYGGMISMVVVPLVLLTAGIIIWAMRRKR